MAVEPPDYISFPPEVFNLHEPELSHNDNKENLLHLRNFNSTKRTNHNFLIKLKKKEYATTALFWAIVTANKPLIKFVLENGSEIIIMSPHINSSSFRHVVYLRIKESTPEMLKYILQQSTALAIHTATEEHGTGFPWTTVLHWAIFKHYPMLLERALEVGANVEQLDHAGYTPLHWAVWGNDAASTRALLEYGANVEAIDKLNRTPLQDAIKKFIDATRESRRENFNPPAVIWLLLENEPDRNFRLEDGWGLTLLHLAAMYGHTTLVLDLLDKLTEGGAVPINIQDSLGRTALHLAAKGSHDDIVALLLKNEAKYLIKDKNGQLAIDLAPMGSNAAELLAILKYPQPLHAPGHHDC